MKPPPDRVHFIFLGLVWVAAHVLIFIHPGVRLDLFDSMIYERAGIYLMENGSLEKGHQFFYACPILLIGIFQSFQNGLLILVILQCLISLCATLALYYSATRLYNDSRAGLFASTFFLLWYDMIQWNTALLTESIFCSLVCFLFLRFIGFQGRTRDYIVLITLLLLILITRPTGIVLIASSIIFLLARHQPALKAKRISSFAFLLFGIVCLAGSWMMFSIWDFSDQYFRGNIITYTDTIDPIESKYFPLRLDTTNLIIPESSLSPIEKMTAFIFQNPAHFVKAAALKVFYLLSGIRPYYSSAHNLLTICWMAFIYTLAIIGFRKTSNAEIRSAIISAVLINCALIAISTVDWDNRFYIPMVPGILLLSARGGLQLLNHFPRLRGI